MRKSSFAIGLISISMIYTACGQSPSFVDKNSGFAASGKRGGTGDGTAHSGADGGAGANGEAADGDSASDASAAAPNEFHSNPSDPNSPTFSVPDLTPAEGAQLSKCLAKWGSVPFQGTLSNVRRIKAAVTVLGIGVALNDTVQTSSPMLTIIAAGVNVLGSPVYNLKNENGYYCMAVNVNVKTNLTINSGCKTHIADNSVQVNVLSTTNATSSVVGVNVLSSVLVQSSNPSGQTCTN